MLGRLFDADESAQLQQMKQNLNSNSTNTLTGKLFYLVYLLRYNVNCHCI